MFDKYGNARVPVEDDPSKPANNVHVGILPARSSFNSVCTQLPCQNKPNFQPNKFYGVFFFAREYSNMTIGRWNKTGHYQAGFEVHGEGQDIKIAVTVCDASKLSDTELCQTLKTFEYRTLSTSTSEVSKLVYPSTPSPNRPPNGWPLDRVEPDYSSAVTAGKPQNIDVKWVDDHDIKHYSGPEVRAHVQLPLDSRRDVC